MVRVSPSTAARTGQRAPGTSPLPIFLAFYQGLSAANANDPTKYTSTQFTNSTNLGFLAQMNPNPYGFASTNATSGFVGNSTFRANGVAAGYPANLFVANPDVTSAQLVTNFGGTNANSVQFEFRDPPRSRLYIGPLPQLAWISLMLAAASAGILIAMDMLRRRSSERATT